MHTSPTVWGVLLAAGAGRRFAKQRPGQDKLLSTLPTGQTLINQSAAALQEHCHEMVVVLPTNQPLRAEMITTPRVHRTYNPDANQGMGSSLAVGAHYLKELGQRNPPPTLVLVALADMPWIKPCSYQAVIQGLNRGLAGQCNQHAPKRIAAPIYGQQRGHPVAFCWSLINALTKQQGDQGARNLLRLYGCLEIAVNDPGIVQDIDRPADISLP